MSFFTALITSKIALGALGVAAVAAGGTAAVAVAGNLPETTQGIVHTASATPAPTASTESADTADSTPTATATATPVGPDATGPAAFGLCTAFTHGGLATTSVAYGSLVTAASGARSIAAYCDTVVAPGKSAAHLKTGTSSTSESEDASSTESEDTTSDEAVAPAAPVLPTQAATGADHKKSGRP